MNISSLPCISMCVYVFIYSYVFDGKPPEMKSEEVSKL